MTKGRIIQIGMVAAGWLALLLFSVFALGAMYIFDGFFGDATNIGWFTILGFVVVGVLIAALRHQVYLRWLLPLLPVLALWAGPYANAQGSDLSMALYMALIITPLVWSLGARMRQIWRPQAKGDQSVVSAVIASAGISIVVWYLQTEGIDGLKDALSDLRNLNYDPDFTSIALVIVILAGCVAGLVPGKNLSTPPASENREMAEQALLKDGST